MIFSKEKWSNGKEISAFVPSSASLSFQKMESSLSSVQQMFLQPLIESTLMKRIENIYGNMDSADEKSRQLLRLHKEQWQTLPSGMTLMLSTCASQTRASSVKAVKTGRVLTSIRKTVCARTSKVVASMLSMLFLISWKTISATIRNIGKQSAGRNVGRLL